MSFHHQNFWKFIVTRNNFKDYFLVDGHCTEKGYKIVADKIVETILPEILGPAEPIINQN